MMPTGEDKRSDFLWLVQMFMLRDNNVIGWHGIAGDALAASYRIPKGKPARDAALEFWAFFNDDFRGDAEKICPSWMMALHDPVYG